MSSMRYPTDASPSLVSVVFMHLNYSTIIAPVYVDHFSELTVASFFNEFIKVSQIEIMFLVLRVNSTR